MKHKYPKSILIIWEDHWYCPDGETTPEVARMQGPKEMFSLGFLVSETDTAYQLALDYSDGVFRHYAFYDKRMIKEIIEMRPYKQRGKTGAVQRPREAKGILP